MRKYRSTPEGKAAAARYVRLSRIRRKILLLNGRESCERCGVDDIRVLQFHHPTDDKKMSVGYYSKVTEDLIQEAGKCEILCSSCHDIIHTTWTEEDIKYARETPHRYTNQEDDT